MSQNINILVTGVMGVGKSTFIKRFMPDSDILVHRSMKGAIHSKTCDIYKYQYGNFTFIDSPGLYDNFTGEHIKCCEVLERTLKKIKILHYVIFVISATSKGIRHIDLKMLDILLEFKHLLPKMIVYNLSITPINLS